MLFDPHQAPTVTSPTSILSALAMLGALLFAGRVGAQCVPLEGTGCPGEDALVCTGPPPPCLPSPSTSCGFTVQTTGSFPTANQCVAPPVILFGSCFLPPLPLPEPLACTAGCTLAVSPVIGSFPDPLFVEQFALPPGSVWCAQAACIATNSSEQLCVNLGRAITVVVGP